MVRRSLKEPMKTKALLRDNTNMRVSSYEGGKKTTTRKTLSLPPDTARRPALLNAQPFSLHLPDASTRAMSQPPVPLPFLLPAPCPDPPFHKPASRSLRHRC